jgi:pimeloyl-ACP methyl ester carboxylesterase
MKSHDVIGGDGITLHVEESGPRTGPPILFINGYSTSGRGWIYQLDSELAADMHLVAMDTRGHGRSEKPEDGYGDPQLWADDIQRVIDAMELEDPVLVASSLAGVFVSDYLSIHGRDDIVGINLVGATSWLGSDTARTLTGEDFLELIPRMESNDAAEANAAINQLWRRVPHEPLSVRDHYFMVGVTSQTPPAVRSQILRRSVSPEDIYRSSEVPVLVTHGEADTIVLPGAARKHADLFPNARTSLYPGVGHVPFLEAPRKFNRELREFVDSR